MKAIRAGDPLSADTDMGPLSTFAQRDLVLGQIEKAKQIGARLLVGDGEKLNGNGAYLTAGVLVDVPADSSFIQEEIFGPVAMVFKAANIDEAIRIANVIVDRRSRADYRAAPLRTEVGPSRALAHHRICFCCCSSEYH